MKSPMVIVLLSITSFIQSFSLVTCTANVIWVGLTNLKTLQKISPRVVLTIPSLLKEGGHTLMKAPQADAVGKDSSLPINPGDSLFPRFFG